MIQPTGPLDAKILIIGEAPGETEEREGFPFVGTAGRVLDGILEEVGIARDRCYVTNVMLERPAGNSFQKFYEGKEPSPQLLEGYQRLFREIASVNPNVIVCLGNEPMKAILGIEGIEKYRGSILDSRFGKVIPTIHPAAVARNWAYRPAVVSDFIKVQRESAFPELKVPKPELVIARDWDTVDYIIKKLKGASHVAFDIETETDQITCISFACSSKWAVCIPFWFGKTGSVWATTEEEGRVWDAVRGLLESQEPKKVAHNGTFDTGELARTMGYHVRGFDYDTMLVFHVLYPELPKGLDYLCSIYTDYPYYKDDIDSSDADTYFRYNAMDSLVTYTCFEHLVKELEEEGLETFYRTQVHAMVEPLLAMQAKGVAFDDERRRALVKEYEHEIANMQIELDMQVGHSLNIASHKQMTDWLYEELKISKRVRTRKSTGNTTLAADEEALEDIYAKKQIPAIRTILEMRTKKKVLSTYLKVKLDDDKRIRCSYNIAGTETGRLSSSASTRGTGTNLQNIPDGVVRSLFVADPGTVLVNADLSQAEARVVAYLAGEDRLIAVFESGGDIHKKNAANIFGKPEAEVTGEERQLAKRVVHASNYGMGEGTFSKTTGIPLAEAKRLLNQYFATYPRIKVWHMETANTLRNTRRLTTPLGRRRVFFNKWDAGLIKEGLAYVPQSTVADIVNQALVCMHARAFDGFDILLQVHDSIVAQVPEGCLARAVGIMQSCLTVPVEINGRVLVIPVDVKFGHDWSNLTKCNGGET